jgi:AcrR family transcriptional regulator
MTGARRAELLDAVLELLREVGYEALTMDAVAARAHTSKATLYRLWEGKAGLVVEALGHRGEEHEPVPDTGSLRGDLSAIADRGAESKKKVSDDQAALLPAVMHAVMTDPELRAAVRQQLIEPGLAELGAVFQRAVDRGEIDPSCTALPYAPTLVISFAITHMLLEEPEFFPASLRGFFDDVVIPLLT